MILFKVFNPIYAIYSNLFAFVYVLILIVVVNMNLFQSIDVISTKVYERAILLTDFL